MLRKKLLKTVPRAVLVDWYVTVEVMMGGILSLGEKGCYVSAGKMILNTDPSPSLLSTSIVPPCDTIIF